MKFNLIKTSKGAAPYSVACDETGAVFFTENRGNCIGIIQNGVVSEYPLPTENAGASVITMCGRQAWFTMYEADKIGNVSAGGTIHEIAVEPGSRPFGITADKEGRIWFTCMGSHKIGCYEGGEVRMFPVPTTDCNPSFITCTVDGDLWFCENQGNKIAHMTTDGAITEYDLPHPASGPVGIAPCGEGAVFVEIMGNRIGHIAPSGVITEYPIATPGAKPHAITSDLSGGYWISLWGANKLAHFSLDGTIVEYDIPISAPEPHGLCAEGQRRIWVALESQGIACFAF